MKMKIVVAENSGTCFGVSNAIDIAFRAAQNNGNVYILGELVHNPHIVNKLSGEGVKQVNDVSELRDGDSLIIRAHGESKEVFDYCEENGISVIDCTCPFVKKAQNIATKLEEEGYQVVIIGNPDHPEVRGIVAQTSNAKVIQTPEDVEKQKVKYGKLGILSQTTQTIENFSETVAKIVTYPKIIKIYNTICTATEERQIAAKNLANKVDLMIVIGGKNSSNTRKLYELCNNIVKTHWIEDAKELENSWFEKVQSIGITAGASTPKEVIDKVKEKISNL